MKKYEQILKSLSLEEKIGQMFMIGFKGETIPDDVKEFIETAGIGFIDIFARNISSVKQATELMNEIHSLGRLSPMIFTDQEGGVVCQFGELTSTVTNPMGLAATNNVGLTKIAAETLAEDMDLIGVDGFIAPSIDVNYEPNNPIIGLRAFSDDVNTVIEHGKAFIEGIEQTGLAAMPKHFPGHGGSRLDSHLVLPLIECSEEYFTAMNLVPFEKTMDLADFIMTAHVAVPDIDPTSLPATFSKIFLDKILRKKMKYKGVVVTDCLEMDVIKNNFTQEEIVDYSIHAGVDVLLSSHTLEIQKKQYNILLDKVKKGEIPEKRIDESVLRILIAKDKHNMLIDNKQRSIEAAEKKVRNKRSLEDMICKHSIVLLRNKLKKVPLKNRNIKLGIIEWDKTKSTVQLYEPTTASYLEHYAKEYFEHVDVLILPLKKPDFKLIKEFIEDKDEIILGPFSRTAEVEALQANAIRAIIKMREDVIVVATGNPYDIRNMPEVKTYLATFGFKNSQIKAFFEILTGEGKPSGILPVEIKELFPRFFKWRENGQMETII